MVQAEMNFIFVTFDGKTTDNIQIILKSTLLKQDLMFFFRIGVSSILGVDVVYSWRRCTHRTSNFSTAS